MYKPIKLAMLLLTRVKSKLSDPVAFGENSDPFQACTKPPDLSNTGTLYSYSCVCYAFHRYCGLPSKYSSFEHLG